MEGDARLLFDGGRPVRPCVISGVPASNGGPVIPATFPGRLCVPPWLFT